MSELKTIYAYTSDEIETICNRAEGDEYYLKTEADEVITKLKAENESLKYSVATLETDLAMIQRWRKCSEELPEKQEWVFVSDGKHRMLCKRVDGAWLFDGAWMPEEHGKIEYWMPEHGKIEYWMPLPKAPKEVDNGLV